MKQIEWLKGLELNFDESYSNPNTKLTITPDSLISINGTETDFDP